MIYYGTQTGTAEKFANVIDDEAHIVGVNSRVVDMEKFTPEDFLQHSFVIFVLATHYEGDPTDTADLIASCVLALEMKQKQQSE